MACAGLYRNPLSHKRLWWRLGWVWVACVLFLTLTPAPPPDPLSLPFADKLAHALAFGWLMWWFAQLTVRRRWVVVFLALVALGVGIEFMQRLGGVRHFEIADMVADVVGAALGAWLARGRAGRALWFLDRVLVRLGFGKEIEERT